MAISCNILTSRLQIHLYISIFVPFLTLTVPLLCSLTTKESESKSQWKLCFKLYCLLDADSISVDSIEYLFLFEQVMEQNTAPLRGRVLLYESVFVRSDRSGADNEI